MWSRPRCAGRARRSARSKKAPEHLQRIKPDNKSKKADKTQAVLCPGRIRVRIIWHTRPVVTSRNTCGKHMETMTHLLRFVAIDTCVYTLREDIILEALDPGGFY